LGVGSILTPSFHTPLLFKLSFHNLCGAIMVVIVTCDRSVVYSGDYGFLHQ